MDKMGQMSVGRLRLPKDAKMASIRKQNGLAGRITIACAHFAYGSLPFWRLDGDIYEFTA
jgi:hypothetical protein